MCVCVCVCVCVYLSVNYKLSKSSQSLQITIAKVHIRLGYAGIVDHSGQFINVRVKKNKKNNKNILFFLKLYKCITANASAI